MGVVSFLGRIGSMIAPFTATVVSLSRLHNNTTALACVRFLFAFTILQPDRSSSVVMRWIPDGGKRRRGRSSKTWRQTFQEDLQEMRVSWSGVGRVASDRSRWKNLVAQCSSRSGKI